MRTLEKIPATELYQSKIDRRTTLKWMTASLGTAALATGCAPSDPSAPSLGSVKPITGTAYGGDPTIMEPVVTWERTMSPEQLQLCARLCDVILPASTDLPAASAVGVPDFIDEFVSSPYQMTRSGRERCFALFNWLETQSLKKYGSGFAILEEAQQKALLDRIAWRDKVKRKLQGQARNFATFRSLAVSAYFASPEGSEWIGYMGNTPAAGDYAGPSEEARKHLADAIAPMGLTIPEGL